MKWNLLFAFYICSAIVCPLAAQTTVVTPLATLTPAENADLQKMRDYYAEGDYQSSLALCQNAIFDNPNNWEAYVQMALCYKALGKADKAALAEKKAKELGPNFSSTAPVSQYLSDTTQPTPAPQVSVLVPPGAPGSPGPKRDNRYSLTLKLGLLGGYANLNNLNDSASLWQTVLSEDDLTGVGSLSHIGFVGTAEVSWGLGQTSAIALRMSYSGGHGFTESYSYGGQSYSQLIDPQLFTLGLDYYQYFPENFGRFFLCGGGFLGEAVVQANSTTPGYTITGTLGGSAIGGEVGLGNEFTLGRNASLEVSIRYQSLIINQVETSYTDNYGDSGELALAQNSAGQVFLADTRAISGTTTYAPLDFSGVLIGFSLNWRVL